VTDFSLESLADGELRLDEQELRRSVSDLQRQRDALLALVEGVGDEIWFADAEGNVTPASPAVWRRSGVSEGEAVETVAARFEVYRADGTPRPPAEAPLLRALRGEHITTIVTFLMVFLIQNTQNRDTQAVQLKLDELIRAAEGADNALMDVEELKDDELTQIRERYADLAERAARELEQRGQQPRAAA
jgi:PAS domain-containing protein